MAGSDVSGNQLRELRAQLEKLTKKNHLERLSVAETASKREIRTAFLGLAKRFHPHRFSHHGQEHEQVANEIFLVIKDAHDALLAKVAGDAAKRKRRTSPPPSQTGRQTTVRFRGKAAAEPEPEPPKAAPIRPLVTPASNGLSGRIPAATISDPRETGATPTVLAPEGPTRGSDSKKAPRPSTRNSFKARLEQRNRMKAEAMSAKRPGEAAMKMKPLTLDAEPVQGSEPEPDSESTPADHSGLVAKLESAEEQNLAHYREASKLLREGRAAEARHGFRKLAVENPTEKRYRTYMHFAWGREHELAGRKSQAETEYQRALNVNPRFTPALEALEALQALTERPGVFGRLFRGRQK